MSQNKLKECLKKIGKMSQIFTKCHFSAVAIAPKRPDRLKQYHCLQFAQSALLGSCITLRPI